MSGLHEELAGGSTPACKVCAYLATVSPGERAEWQSELALPVSIVHNMAAVAALKRRGVDLEEASMRRHRKNHGSR